MKKRIKLFSTIASLCLAVALMAFGVYAAGNSTLNLTSTVSYVVSGNVNVKFDVSVTASDPDTVTRTAPDADTANNETKGTWTWSATQGTADKDIGATIDLGAYAFQVGAAAEDTITYTVKITNLGQYAVVLAITGGPTADTTSSVNIAVTGADTTEIAAAGAEGDANVATYTVTYTLKDVTKDFNKDATANFTPKFVVSVK